MQRLTELKKKTINELINALNVTEDWQNYSMHKVFSRIDKHFN